MAKPRKTFIYLFSMSVLGQQANCGETDSMSIFTVGIGTDLNQRVNKIHRCILSFTLNVYLVVHCYNYK